MSIPAAKPADSSRVDGAGETTGGGASGAQPSAGEAGADAPTAVIRKDDVASAVQATGAAGSAGAAAQDAEPGSPSADTNQTVVIRRSDLPGKPGQAEAVQGSRAGTTAGEQNDGPRAGQQPDVPGDAGEADAATVAMPMIPVDDQKTTALPIQRPDQTDRVTGRPPLSKPPSTPRPAAGPRQAGSKQAGPSGPPPAGPHGPEQGRPHGPEQGRPHGPEQGRPPATGRGGPQNSGQGGPPGLVKGGPQGPAQGPGPGGPQGPAQGMQQGPAQGGPQRSGPTQGQQGPGQGGPQRPPQGMQQGPVRVGPGGPALVQAGSAPSPADRNATRPAQPLDERPRQIAQPQRVPPASAQPAAQANGESGAGHSRRWLLAVGAAVVLVLALIGVATALVGGGDSPEDQVRAAIGDYTSALHDGDLEALRNSTCGALHEFYRDLPADQFAGVHQQSVQQRSIPLVASVDAIKITDSTALALATVYTEADPGSRSERTFDLEKSEDGWKVCDRPIESP